MRFCFWLAGLALLVGGLMAGACHLFNLDSPSDVTHLSQHIAQYASLRAPVHLALFAGGMLVLLGWFGHYALQYSGSGKIGLAAFVCLFLGIIWGDLLQCILQFSVFPVLDAIAPYALPGLADATYQSMPVSLLLTAGHVLLFAGVPAAALAVYRSRIVPVWPAIPFALTAALQVLALIPRWGESVRASSFAALYFSLAILCVAVLWSVRKRGSFVGPVAHDRKSIYREDSRPAAR
jgi:hypothetical protein